MRRAIYVMPLLILLLVPSICLAGPPVTTTNKVAQLSQVRWALHTDAASGANSIRLVFDVTGPVKVDGMIAASPTPCLVVNVSGAVPGKIGGGSVKLDGKIANNISVRTVDRQNSKITIALPLMINDGDYSVSVLRGDATKPFRVVIDIKKPVPSPELNFTSGLKGKVIVIDPGHGGSDPGAIGPAGIQEKSVTLAVAMKVKELLDKAGAKVYTTRTDDRDVYAPNDSAAEELGARADVGNNNEADVFLDIHANYFADPQVGGTGTYYYPKSTYDRLLAQNIQDSVVSADGLNDRGIYQANFYVLKHTVMPAMLIELGFISNPGEEKLLNTPQFQQTLAQGIVTGLNNFFIQAAQQGGNS